MKVTGRELVGCHHVHAGVGHLKVVEGMLCPCLSLSDLWRHTVNHRLVNCSEAGQAGKAWDLNQNHLLGVWNPNSARRCSQSRHGLQYGSRDLGSLSSQLPRVKGSMAPGSPRLGCKGPSWEDCPDPCPGAVYHQAHTTRDRSGAGAGAGPCDRNQPARGPFSSKRGGPSSAQVGVISRILNHQYS